MSEYYFVKRKWCPACHGSDNKAIYSCNYLESPIKEFLISFYSTQGLVEFEYLKGADFTLKECDSCGMIYQEEIPNDHLMKKLYEEWIDPKMALHRNDNLAHYANNAHEIMTILLNFENKSPREIKCFDFGMGWGKWCQMAKAFGCEVFGAELSRDRIDHAHSSGIKIIHWDEIPNYQFNFINTEQVLEHIPEPLESLCHLKKSLTPDGIIKINVPNGSYIKKKLKIADWAAPKGSRHSLNPVSPLEHINCYKQSTIRIMADKAGLRRIKIPLSLQYAATTNWHSIQQTFRNIILPLYRNLTPLSTYCLFQSKE